MKWNREEFENIFAKKHQLLRRIEGVQRALALNEYSPNLVKLDFLLHQKMEEVLKQEELYWFQRSKEEWIVSGERNTKFHHLAVKVKKKRKLISALQDSNGQWVTAEASLENLVVQFYKGLFTNDSTYVLSNLEGIACRRIPEELRADLEKSYEKEEVARALFQMAPFKTAGEDGFTAGFFQRSWSVLGNVVCDLVLGVLHGNPLPDRLNSILITLIPKLNNMIAAFVNEGLWKPIPICRGGPAISHLMFADDMVLFAEASVEQMGCILKILNDFSLVSGQRINFSKSSIFFSPNITSDLAESLVNMAGMARTDSLGSHLRMPSIHGRVGPTSFREVIDKMKHRLFGWKASTHSKAGRVTMISSVLNAIPVFLMQITVLPISVCKEMEKICRDFLWHGNSSDKKLHLALVGKLVWRALHSCDEFWAKYLFKKYAAGRASWDMKMKSGASMNWRAVCFGLELLRKGISHNVVYGNEILFWTDS
ncbi:uncharacterized protein LOC110624960 [Manihot esculenta]|uniref:uncharacterized protein LOC110624960 n=1 Tax=Manihot esculenta TaxID=3983 RepID=UPI000B5D622A|nr:uncharacterized protein LOC110624960 [Manihot esculenta]